MEDRMQEFVSDSRLSLCRLKEAIVYDQNTGSFVWNESRIGVKLGKKAGTVRPGGHVQLTIDRNHHLAHRVAWLYMTGAWPAHQVDHKDGNPSNNIWENLRVATNAQNQANRRLGRNSSSGYKGATFIKSKRKWRSGIKKDGKGIHLGYFDTPHEAHEAYCEASVKLFGEFARAA